MTAPARPYDKKHKNERQRKATHHRIGCSCRKIGQGYGIADDQDNGANACQARTASPRASEISEYETAKCKTIISTRPGRYPTPNSHSIGATL
jgi:hypothetical protein